MEGKKCAPEILKFSQLAKMIPYLKQSQYHIHHTTLLCEKFSHCLDTVFIETGFDTEDGLEWKS